MSGETREDTLQFMHYRCEALQKRIKELEEQYTKSLNENISRYEI